MRPVKRGVIAILVILGLAFSAAACNPVQPVKPITVSPASPALYSTEGLDVMDQAWRVIHDNYVEPDKINSTNMSSAAVKGMVKALNDPYTRYFSPQAYQLILQNTKGKYQGIGASVATRNGKRVIIATLPNSPAASAGILIGDTILAVDGKLISEMSPEEAELRVRGPAGTAVKLLVLHQTKPEPEEISVVRADIDLPTVRFDMKGDIAYIRIYRFYEHTDQELSTILTANVSRNATGIILDLRSNTGGLESALVKVAGHFIKSGIVAYTVDNQGRRSSVSVSATGVTTDLPMVVLSDNFSASASEALMGALQDYGRATIAGTRTFGKGSVDQFFKLKDGSALYVTIGRWLTPKERAIEGRGIEPDIRLTLQGDNTTQWAIDYLHGKK